MFHVYVDPLFGDNQKAVELNPTNPHDISLNFLSSGRPLPLSRHADGTMGSGGSGQRIEGFLQHAPYSFKTLSSPQSEMGAVEYVQRPFVVPQTTPIPTLPWTHPDGDRRVTHVVIHCLPGLYGPIHHGYPDPPDPASGLPWNGEELPIKLGVMPFDLSDVPATDRISIQGTSALDTIFDARGEAGPVFEFTLPDPALFTYSPAHGEAFLDAVTVRGAAADESGNGAGAGIHIRGRHENAVTISNCFIVDNSVGIAVNSDFVVIGTSQYVAAHRPIITLNTIVDNTIGVWLGDLDPDPLVVQSLNTPVLLNNLFAFEGGQLAQVSCFEGVQPGDVTVASIGSPAVTVGSAYNTWDTSRANLGGTLVPGFPAHPQILVPAPRVDTDLWDQLFIRDAFEAAGTGGGGYSPHDYRLNPNARLALSPGALPTHANPLIDTALAADLVMMGNNITISAADTGLPIGSEEVDINARDWDSEGFGNPRHFNRVDFPTPLDHEGMDFGADEAGDLIVAGYLPNTRIFSVPHAPAATTLTDHLDIYFFDTPAGSSGHLRPVYNTIGSFEFGWYDHVINKPDVLPGQGHDYVQHGTPGSAREQFSMLFRLVGPGDPPLEPFMRNLRCDISPHLAQDLHPVWPALMEQIWPFPPSITATDAYACNPWHSHNMSPNGFHQPDNPALFHNTGMATHSTEYTVYQGSAGTTFVSTASLNPPLTFPAAPFASRLVPLVYWFVSIPGPSGCPAGSTTYDVGAFGFSICPDRINPLGATGEGLRLNLESVAEGERNLQTMLVIPAESNGLDSTSELAPTPTPTDRILRQAVRDARAVRR